MPQSEKAESAVETPKFGKWEFRKGVYQVYTGRLVIGAGGRTMVDPQDPSFALTISRLGEVDLDDPEFIEKFPDPEIRYKRLAKAREFLMRSGATELTEEIQAKRAEIIKTHATKLKELKRLEGEETILRNKQRTSMARKVQSIRALT